MKKFRNFWKWFRGSLKANEAKAIQNKGNFWKWFRGSLKDSGWFSAYVQLLFLFVTIYALFLTNITENFVTSLNQEVKKINLDIENLNASKEKITNDKTNLEKELQELKELKRKYVSNVGQVIINNIIQELENKYKESLVLNEKLSTMEELEILLNKLNNEENYETDTNLSHLERVNKFISEENTRKRETRYKKEERASKLLLPEFYTTYEVERIFQEDERTDVFNQQKELFLQKNNQYGYELINSLSITLLPNSDKIKLENFLNNYSKKTIYQKPIYLRISKWDYAYIKENSTISQKNISDLENDLPNLKIKLKEFFNNL